MHGKAAGELTVCDDAYRLLCRELLELENLTDNLERVAERVNAN